MGVLKSTKKMVLLSVLTAIGSILMLIEIPYPPVPFLKFDLSDVAVLLTAQTFGLGPAIFVSIAKSVTMFLIRGTTNPWGIGLIAAAISSIAISCFYVGAKKYFAGEKKLSRIMRFIIPPFGMALVMTLANFLFITPIFFTGGSAIWFTQLPFEVTLNDFIDLPFNLGYAATIILVYMPFNLLSGTVVMTTYRVIAPRLVETLKRIVK